MKANPEKHLHNTFSRVELLEKIKEIAPQETASFYKYFFIKDPLAFRDLLYKKLRGVNVLGRVYVAHEGVNGQISFPSGEFGKVYHALADTALKECHLNGALENGMPSFYKLVVKVRKKIVDDGQHEIDILKRGKELEAEAFHQAMREPETVVVDVRNGYEHEVGHFEGAIGFRSEFFRDQLPEIENVLAEKKPKKILMYCTGGIRCEKASAYLIERGFQNVNILKSGIVGYGKTVKEKNIKSLFKGKNFTFDMRLGERVTDDVIARCHQCGVSCDQHVNCKNILCNLLFLQCPSCAEKKSGCCTTFCAHLASLPKEERDGYLPHFTLAKKKNIYNAYAKGHFELITDIPILNNKT